jgi:hypothetical protein
MRFSSSKANAGCFGDRPNDRVTLSDTKFNNLKFSTNTRWMHLHIRTHCI